MFCLFQKLSPIICKESSNYLIRCFEKEEGRSPEQFSVTVHIINKYMSSKSEFTYLMTPIFTYCMFTTFLKKNQSSFCQGICCTSLMIHNIKEEIVPKEMWAANFPVSERTIS